MNLPIEIDLRGLSGERRRTMAEAALQELSGDASVIFVSDCEPNVLAGDLDACFPGTFDFAALEQTPTVRAVEVHRHAARRTLQHVLEFEHARVDRLLAEVEWRLGQRRIDEAHQRFEQLRTRCTTTC